MTKNLNVITDEEVKKLTEEEVKEIAEETIEIKGHQVYFVTLGNIFGYSALVFKNNRQIVYATLYQLHHRNNSKEELRKKYQDILDGTSLGYYTHNALYTEEEIQNGFKNYLEYDSQRDYVINYLPYCFSIISSYDLNDMNINNEEKEKISHLPRFLCYYFRYKDDFEKVKNTYYLLSKNFSDKITTDKKFFRSAINYELANHEACITCSNREALESLGLSYEDLSPEFQKIVDEELHKQIYREW